MPTAANEVGYAGEKKRLSIPPTREVRFQSKRIVPVLNRNIPEADPLFASGNSPKKSATKFPCVFAPATVGPKTSSPNCDWRYVAAKLPPVLAPVCEGLDGSATPGTSK